jgi:hypothetical protein
MVSAFIQVVPPSPVATERRDPRPAPQQQTR